MSFEEVRAAALALPLKEKYELAEALGKRIEQEEVPEPMPDWLYEECERRRKELEDHPERGIPGDEFYRRLKAKYGI